MNQRMFYTFMEGLTDGIEGTIWIIGLFAGIGVIGAFIWLIYHLISKI